MCMQLLHHHSRGTRILLDILHTMPAEPCTNRPGVTLHGLCYAMMLCVEHFTFTSRRWRAIAMPSPVAHTAAVGDCMHNLCLILWLYTYVVNNLSFNSVDLPRCFLYTL
jgi:hypothetical protein